MITASKVAAVGRQDPTYRDEILNVGKYVDVRRHDGGSLLLRKYLRGVALNKRILLSDKQVRYLANEMNYLLAKYSLRHVKLASHPTESSTPFSLSSKKMSLPPIENQNLSNSSNSEILRHDASLTESWVHNTLFYIKRLGNAKMSHIDANVLHNLFSAEVGATVGGGINAKLVNALGYMGPFQMGVAEWAANRIHGFEGTEIGCVPAKAASYCRSGVATGPADVLVSPAVWVRYISKVAPRIPDHLFNYDVARSVYLAHNIGLGNVVELLKWAKVGVIKPSAAWAIFTQLGYLGGPKGRYKNSVRKALAKAGTNHRPLRSFIAAIRSEGSRVDERTFIQAMIDGSRPSFSARIAS